MFARIENDQIVEYPLNAHEIKSRFENTTFPVDFTNNLPDGYVVVLPSGQPAQNELKVVTEGAPTLVDGSWVQVWVETDKYTPEELEQRQQAEIASRWESLRDDRNQAIANCEWIVQRHQEQLELGVATSITQGEYMAWLTYRQQLRDFPATVADVMTAVLPTAPGQLGIA